MERNNSALYHAALPIVPVLPHGFFLVIPINQQKIDGHLPIPRRIVAERLDPNRPRPQATSRTRRPPTSPKYSRTNWYQGLEASS